MSLIDSIVAKIAPHDCLGCRAEGSLLCPDCIQKLPFGGSPPHIETQYLDSIVAATLYEGLAKKLVWKLKSKGAQEAATIMANCMLPYVKRNRRTVLVAVPTATRRVRQRGYDQAKLLARQLARQAKQPWMDCLTRSGQAEQVGANRDQRLNQLAKSFRVTQQRFVRGAHIILIDDIVTTGATLEAAARILKQSGAGKIEALTFARPELRNYQNT